MPRPLQALHALARELDPELVVVTGDLSHRGRRAELEHAAGILSSLERPFLVVPGNHDIPYTFPRRFTRTFTEWERVFTAVEPTYRSEWLFVAGLNSVRPWRQQAGAVREEQLERAATHLKTAPEGALTIVALHHHLAAPPWRAKRKRPLARRDAVLQSLASAGAQLVVGGHVHQASVAERREFEVLEGGHRSLVLATAPGFGRPRPRRKGEAQGANVYEADQGLLSVTTYAWNGSTLTEVARRRFRAGSAL